MPIKIADKLPACAILESENIFVMTEHRALHQDIRPLKIVLLNLMPTKIATETQILRCLSNTPLQIEVDLLQTKTHQSKNTPEDHLFAFYKTFDEIRASRYDGMIITGAPVELMDYEQVDYWSELCQIMDWSQTNVTSTLHICWGAQAGLYYHYGIPKYILPEKRSGVFAHQLLTPREPLFRGFDDIFYAPHSRHTEVREADIRAVEQLQLMACSPEAGVYAVGDREGRNFFIMGHSEYDATTLASEYYRDLERQLAPKIPVHYFKNDNPESYPVVSWRAHATLLYTNWLNYYVYQTTPYDLDGQEGG